MASLAAAPAAPGPVQSADPAATAAAALRAPRSTSAAYTSCLELPTVLFDAAAYICTSSGNNVSRQSVLCGTSNIHLHGKTIIAANSVLRGDLSHIRIGRYCILSDGCVVRPTGKRFSRGFAFIPMQLGNYVCVGERSVVEAAQIGSHVMIGKDCVIGARCIIRDCCEIVDGSVLAPGTVMPPFSRYAGSPARLVEELPGCVQEEIKEFLVEKYRKFRPK
jgi:dynactin-5